MCVGREQGSTAVDDTEFASGLLAGVSKAVLPARFSRARLSRCSYWCRSERARLKNFKKG